MRHIIEVEEIVKVRHQIVVEIDNEDQIEMALDNVNACCGSLDEFVDGISDIIPVVEINEEFYAEVDNVEYCDDYEDDAI